MESRKYRILAIGTSVPPLMEKENINSTSVFYLFKISVIR